MMSSSQQDDNHDNDKNDKKQGKWVHSYSSCLSCRISRHDLCQLAHGGWAGQGGRRRFVSTCECADNNHEVTSP